MLTSNTHLLLLLLLRLLLLPSQRVALRVKVLRLLLQFPPKTANLARRIVQGTATLAQQSASDTDQMKRGSTGMMHN